MSDEDKISLSRRKALAGIGTVGAAVGLGGIGTYAQFTDTEKVETTFTSGGVDGIISATASYNGNDISGDLRNVEIEGFDILNNGQVANIFNLTDVKPGDYGSITFEIEVENNPAWVAGCINYGNNFDGKTYEPEIYHAPEEQNTTTLADKGVGSVAETRGDLADNLLFVPFYSPGPNTFFDRGGAPDGDWTAGDMGAYGDGTTAAFWNSREGTNDFNDLQPKTLAQAAADPGSKNTLLWNEDDGLVVVPGPEGSSMGQGCVLLDGDASGDPNTFDDEREVAPLEVTDTLSFGWDWHLPYTTGNSCQGDEVTISLGFNFSQIRHSDAPQFQNSYDPGNFTPN